MSDFIVICRNLDVATNIGREFAAKLSISGELKYTTEGGKTVCTTDGDRYYFTDLSSSEKLIRGRRDYSVYGGRVFESALNMFDPADPEVEFKPGASKYWKDTRVTHDTRPVSGYKNPDIKPSKNYAARRI